MATSELQHDKNGFGCMTSILAVIASIIFFILGYTWIGWLFLIPTLFLNLISFMKYLHAIKRNRKELSKQLENLKPETSGFMAAHTFISYNQLTKIAVDEQAKRICIWAPEKPDMTKGVAGMVYKIFEYNYPDVLAVEMAEDGVSLGTKSSHSKTAHSLLDGFFSKTDGTFIGGSQPSEKKKKHVESLDLTIIVNDSARPLHTINFYTFTGEGGQPQLKKSTPAYRDCMNKLRSWYMLLSFIMEDVREDNMCESIHEASPTEHLSSSEPLHEPSSRESLYELDSLSAMDELLEESKRRQHGK